MVSFSCENCGDVLTKKKLDQHHNRCYGQFTCIDCMTTFPGTSYRAHTSCITEDQKYQGALYKEKPSKNKKSVNIVEPQQKPSRRAYVEDAPDQDDQHATVSELYPVTTLAKIPEKPNVFDFLVDDETPNASRVNLSSAAEPMQMVAHAPPVFRSHSQSPPSTSGQDAVRTESLGANGYAYGEGPVPTSKAIDVYRTPAPKDSRRRKESPSRYAPEVVTSTVKKSTDKKRKRQVEELDLSQAQAYHNAAGMEVDDPNFVPLPLQHSGLTGGLSRMLSKTGQKEYPPSPAYSNGHDDKENDSEYSDIEETPLNPVKTRRDRDHRQKDEKEKERDSRRGRPSATSTLLGAAGALVKVRRSRRTSDESRPRKHHRSHRHRSDEHPDRERHRRVSGESEVRRRKTKAIEWKDGRSASDDDYDDVEGDANGDGQMVLYKDGERRASSSRRDSGSGRSKAERFLSYVKKGPDSEKGCSINKALKRYHRDRLADFDGRKEERDRDRIDDEKDLWKCLRLRRNERGEMVVFILEGED